MNRREDRALGALVFGWALLLLVLALFVPAGCDQRVGRIARANDGGDCRELAQTLAGAPSDPQVITCDPAQQLEVRMVAGQAIGICRCGVRPLPDEQHRPTQP